jgi:PAS domain S-box-containing protein
VAVRLGQAFTDAAMASLGEGVFGVDLDGRLTFMNPAAMAILGRTEAELLGREMHGLVHAAPGPAESCPLLAVMRTGEPARSDDDVFAGADGRLLPVAWSSTPIVVDGEVVGAVVAFHDVTQAQETARKLRQEVQLTETLLHIASRLSAELNLEAVVQTVTDAGVQLTGAQFGAFFYNLIDDNGERYTLYAISGVDRRAFDGFPLPRNTPVFGPTFRGEGITRLDDVTASPLFGTMPPHHGMPSGHLPVRSYLAVPVVSRTGEVLGGLFFGHEKPGVFDEADERLIAGIASHASVAVDNARQFGREQEVAEALQRSLLPRRLPHLRGVSTAARYEPASSDVEVGGDWYDVIPLPTGSVAAVIGDVAGHSVHAATVMGQVRNALRAYALEGHSPAVVVERANRFLAAVEPDEMVTLCYIELSREQGTATVVRAGHPPPVLAIAGEGAWLLEIDGGLPLGVDPDASYVETTVLLERGSTLVLYTDGLVERSDLPVDVGLHRLREAVESASWRDVDSMAGATMATTVGDAATADDAAILVIRVHDVAMPQVVRDVSRRLPADPASVASARRFVSDVLAEWSVPHLLDDVLLLTSELVTNAVLYTAEEVELRLTMRGPRLRVEVVDSSGERPVRLRTADPGATSGRGLLLVETLAEQWGVDVQGVGKVVWFELPVAKDAA